MKIFRRHFNIGPWTKRFAILSLILVFMAILSIWLVCPPIGQMQQGPIKIVSWKNEDTTGPKTGHWIPLKMISKHLIHAILIAEDDRFYDHFGVDFHEIFSSAAKNIRVGRYARGASTITQQVVKMVFLGPEKTIERKIREGLGAIYLETLLSKEEILEWYLNIVDFGNGTFGVKRASKFYFNTLPHELSLNEAIHLALILPAPNKWSRGLKVGQLTEFGRKRFSAILNRMEQKQYITSLQHRSSLQTGDFGNPI